MIRPALIVASLLLLAGAAWAQTEPAVLATDAAGQLEAAAQALQKAKGGRNQVQALTETVQAYEEGLAALRAGMRLAARKQRILEALLEARDEEISRLLGALSAMGRSPGPLLLLHPSGPIGTARAGMIVSDFMPDLQAEADGLRDQLRQIADLQALQDQAGAALAEGMAGAQEARTELSQAMADRTDLPMRYSADPDRMHALAENAKSLDSFAAGLVDLGPGLAEPTGFEDLKGTLPQPVQGVVLRGFREADAAGVRRPGLLVATRPGALVTAPAEATIRYVGPLLDYGNVMILEPSDSILLVLAGMGTVYGVPGEVVQAGSAIGLMGGPAASDDAFVAESQESGGVGRSETLYIELRQGEAPVDPGAWFAPTKGE